MKKNWVMIFWECVMVCAIMVIAFYAVSLDTRVNRLEQTQYQSVVDTNQIVMNAKATGYLSVDRDVDLSLSKELEKLEIEVQHLREKMRDIRRAIPDTAFHNKVSSGIIRERR